VTGRAKRNRKRLRQAFRGVQQAFKNMDAAVQRLERTPKNDPVERLNAEILLGQAVAATDDASTHFSTVLAEYTDSLTKFVKQHLPVATAEQAQLN
jgi:hypothetical protein